MKLIFVNNYSMEYVYKACLEKKIPNHHLWGANKLKDFGIEIEILSFSKYPFLKRQVSHRGILGDLDQQLQYRRPRKETSHRRIHGPGVAVGGHRAYQRAQ